MSCHCAVVERQAAHAHLHDCFTMHALPGLSHAHSHNEEEVRKQARHHLHHASCMLLENSIPPCRPGSLMRALPPPTHRSVQVAHIDLNAGTMRVRAWDSGMNSPNCKRSE